MCIYIFFHHRFNYYNNTGTCHICRNIVRYKTKKGCSCPLRQIFRSGKICRWLLFFAHKSYSVTKTDLIYSHMNSGEKLCYSVPYTLPECKYDVFEWWLMFKAILILTEIKKIWYIEKKNSFVSKKLFIFLSFWIDSR